jgi:hypothetical protein
LLQPLLPFIILPLLESKEVEHHHFKVKTSYMLALSKFEVSRATNEGNSSDAQFFFCAAL